VRSSNAARYLAKSGSERSLNLKLTRRVIVEPITSSNRKVTITGRVTPPLGKPIAPIAVQQQVSCTRSIIVERIRPDSSGHFHTTFAAPADQQAAVYRLNTSVPAVAGKPKRFPTFSLPEAVELH
jgi:hypothetical protein